MTVPLFNLTDTWNNAGQNFTAIQMNVNKIADAGGSLLMDLQVGGQSKFQVSADGVGAQGVFTHFTGGNYWVASSPATIAYYGTLNAASLGLITNNTLRLSIDQNGATQFNIAAVHAPLFIIASTIDDNAGPILRLYQNSPTPAVGDQVGDLMYGGNNSALAFIPYGEIDCQILNATAGAERSRLQFWAWNAGVQNNCFEIGGNFVEAFVQFFASGPSPNLNIDGNSQPAIRFIPNAGGSNAWLFHTGAANTFWLTTDSTNLFGVDLGTGFFRVQSASSTFGTADRQFHVEQDSATTNAVTYVERLTSTTSGTAATGMGVGMEFELENGSGNNKVGATIEVAAQSVTNGAEIIPLNAKQMAAGALQDSLGLSFLLRSLSADTAYSNVNTVQPWFPSGGAVSVEASTTYEFEGLLLQTNGTTSHTVSLSFGGSATLTSIAYSAEFTASVVNTLGTAANITQVTQAAATVVTPAITTAGTAIKVRGIVRVNGAGTLIPQFTFSAAPGVGNNLNNTFFKLRKVGTNTNTSQGNWA